MVFAVMRSTTYKYFAVAFRNCQGITCEFLRRIFVERQGAKTAATQRVARFFATRDCGKKTANPRPFSAGTTIIINFLKGFGGNFLFSKLRQIRAMCFQQFVEASESGVVVAD